MLPFPSPNSLQICFNKQASGSNSQNGFKTGFNKQASGYKTIKVNKHAIGSNIPDGIQNIDITMGNPPTGTKTIAAKQIFNDDRIVLSNIDTLQSVNIRAEDPFEGKLIWCLTILVSLPPTPLPSLKVPSQSPPPPSVIIIRDIFRISSNWFNH